MLRTKGITADGLLKQSNRPIVDAIVADLIKTIDAKILTAHGAGFDYIEFDLPVNFNINNMDKADAQLMVYSELILAYTNPRDKGGKGFTNLTIDGDSISTKLYIKWTNGVNAQERVRRQRILASYKRK